MDRVQALVVLIIVVVVGTALYLAAPHPEAAPAPTPEVETTEIPIVSRTCTKALFQANDAITLLSKVLVVARKATNAAIEQDVDAQKDLIEKQVELDKEVEEVLERNLALTEQCVLEEGV